MKIEFIAREISSDNWVAIVLLCCAAIVALNNIIFGKRFSEFFKLIYSDKYIHIYKDTYHLKSWFTISMFVQQLLCFSFLIYFGLRTHFFSEPFNFVDYFLVLNFCGFFILTKYLIEKIISVCFNIEEFAESYNLIKLNYRSYLGLLLLPLAFFIFFSPLNPTILLAICMLLSIFINGKIYYIIVKKHGKLIIGYTFYFILYICTLEIAPYLILYKWFSN